MKSKFFQRTGQCGISHALALLLTIQLAGLHEPRSRITAVQIPVCMSSQALSPGALTGWRPLQIVPAVVFRGILATALLSITAHSLSSDPNPGEPVNVEAINPSSIPQPRVVPFPKFDKSQPVTETRLRDYILSCLQTLGIDSKTVEIQFIHNPQTKRVSGVQSTVSLIRLVPPTSPGARWQFQMNAREWLKRNSKWMSDQNFSLQRKIIHEAYHIYSYEERTRRAKEVTLEMSSRFGIPASEILGTIESTIVWRDEAIAQMMEWESLKHFAPDEKTEKQIKKRWRYTYSEMMELIRKGYVGATRIHAPKGAQEFLREKVGGWPQDTPETRQEYWNKYFGPQRRTPGPVSQIDSRINPSRIRSPVRPIQAGA